MLSTNVNVPSSKGYMMAGTIDRPDGPAQAYAIFAHCFAGSRHTPGASRISKQLTQHGIATLRFDFPGLGQSEGEFKDTSFSENVDDIVAAAQWLEANYKAPQLLMGHSLGGAAALKAATRPELKKMVKAVATVGAPFDPAHSVLHYANAIGEADANGSVPVVLGGRELIISREFLEDLADTNPEEYLPKLRKPLLLVHSPIDVTVGIDEGDRIGWTTTVRWFGIVGSAIGLLLWWYVPHWVPAGSDWGFIVAVIAGTVFGILLAGFVPLGAIMPALAPDHKGAAMAMYTTAAGGATFLGSAVVAVVRPWGGDVGVVWAFVVLYALAFLMTFALKVDQPRVGKKDIAAAEA